jgi:hypothetical protein
MDIRQAKLASLLGDSQHYLEGYGYQACQQSHGEGSQ